MARLRVLCLLACVPVVGALVPGAGGTVSRSSVEAPSFTAYTRIEQRRPRLGGLPAGARAARIALKAVGTPYRWGGSSTSGFDCSGLVMWAFGSVGIALPHHAATLAQLGRRVPRGDLRPGDLVFFTGYGHVGVYVGGGRMVHAPQSGERVRVERLAGNYGRRFVEARRVHA